ncbi:mersacidin/lichenicidin family type 2 lantibiotic [Lysinibacillus xylanilyticus]|uniref:mersacidin/lichenicidin family type 2 lantibiotic n=1 Tax=Lysinibacillus xylanilyticus TaxID=582475 RepID=UPI002B243220|nr:mersacidin/lichenicidin family type 2 lantibiotic [Lysinibacillus xylanilyticus]MEB2300819.1 mersacidin/lichenicidin family type 2 lantibiotic [Lysinibacillus xylanilyticus]
MSNTNLTKEEIIAAWKDPEAREKFNSLPVHPSGKSFGELTEEELAQIQGASGLVYPTIFPNNTTIPTAISTIIKC